MDGFPPEVDTVDFSLRTLLFLVAHRRVIEAADVVELLDTYTLMPDQARLLEMLRSVLVWHIDEELARERAKRHSSSLAKVLPFAAPSALSRASESSSSRDRSSGG